MACPPFRGRAGASRRTRWPPSFRRPAPSPGRWRTTRPRCRCRTAGRGPGERRSVAVEVALTFGPSPSRIRRPAGDGPRSSSASILLSRGSASRPDSASQGLGLDPAGVEPLEGVRAEAAPVGDGVVVDARRAVAEVGERRSVAVEVARYLQGHLPLAFVAQAEQRSDDGLLAVLLGEGLCVHGVPQFGGKGVPPLRAELQPAVARRRDPPDALGKLLDVPRPAPGCVGNVRRHFRPPCHPVVKERGRPHRRQPRPIPNPNRPAD